MDQYDVYLAYASEDVGFATELRERLEALGLVVWHDAVQLLVGPSLREQMEVGLRASAFGVVILSRRFFEKKWTIDELDGLFALERPGEIRILPVWLDVDVDVVRTKSPMLAGRKAAVYKGYVDGLADELTRSVVALSRGRSLAALVRAEILTGLTWVGPIEFLHKSFELLDEQRERFAPVDLAIYPGLLSRPPPADVTPLPLKELHIALPMHAGRFVLTIAHQVPGTLQVLADRGPLEDAGLPESSRLVSYVFQLRSVDSSPADLTYVQAIGPYGRGVMLPAPSEGSLTWVTGLPLARGATGPSAPRLTSYLMATSIIYTPPGLTS